MKTGNQTQDEFNRAAVDITRQVAEQQETLWPGSRGLRVSFGHGYTDLDLGDAS